MKLDFSELANDHKYFVQFKDKIYYYPVFDKELKIVYTMFSLTKCLLE